jgi:hypothetical protein
MNALVSVAPATRRRHTSCIRAIAPVFVAATLLVAPAAAQGPSDAQRAKVATIDVVVMDGVKDSCLPDVPSLKHVVERELRLSGVGTEAIGGLPVHSLDIAVIGGRLAPGVCVVSYRLELWRFEALADGTRGMVEAFGRDGLLWGPTAGLQRRLDEQIRALAHDLAAAIAAARESVQRQHRTGLDDRDRHVVNVGRNGDPQGAIPADR